MSRGILHSMLFIKSSALCTFWNNIDQNRFHIHSIVSTPPGYTLFYMEYCDAQEESND